MTEKNISKVSAEMDKKLMEDAFAQANAAIDMKTSEKEISLAIKKYFDEKYSPTWHCVVGKNFASYVSYESKHYIFFYVGQLAILLYKMS